MRSVNMDSFTRIFVIFLASFIKYTNSGLTRRAPTPEIEIASSRSFYNNTPMFIRRNNVLIIPNSQDENFNERTHNEESLKIHIYSEQRHTNDDAMLFPDTENDSRDILVNKRNENQEFSTEASMIEEEDISNYPVDEIRRLISQSPLLKQYFSTPPVIGTRNKEHEEGLEPLCEIKSRKSFYPRKLKNIHEEDVLVVNDEKEGYLQAVEFKECGTKNSRCKFDMFGYSSLCIQKYETRQLMVYANATNKLLFDQFKVPSCCVCMIKKVNAK